MNGTAAGRRRRRVVFCMVLFLLLGLSVPLQYLVHRKVVVGLAPGEAHHHAHAHHEVEGGTAVSEHHHEEETDVGVPAGVNLVTNFGFEVGTLEQAWGWERTGTDQGCLVYRDAWRSYRGMSSAAVDASETWVFDAGWYTRLESVPAGQDVIAEAYVKTESLQGIAYLKVMAEGEKEGGGTTFLVWVSTPGLTGSRDWTPCTLRCHLPPQVTGLWLEVGVAGRGRAWFDDVSLEAVEHKDVLEEGVNLLQNPSFDEGFTGWHPFKESGAAAGEDFKVVEGSDGSRALVMQGREGGEVGVYQSLCGFYAEEGELELKCRYRPVDGDAFLSLVSYGTDGVREAVMPLAASPAGSGSEAAGKVKLDGKTVSLWVKVYLEGEGKLVLEDLSLVYRAED